MINPAELVRRPVRERDLLPVATDDQAIQHFQEVIDDIRRVVTAPVRVLHDRDSNPLLHISGEEEYSLIGGRNFRLYSSYRYPSLDAMRIEKSRAQELLFRTMEAYGFDQNVSHPRLKYHYDNKGFEEDVIVRLDGTTREATLYPSQKTKGLVFERVRSFVTDTGGTTDVLWNVVDESPKININVKNIFRRKPKPQILP